MKTIEFTDLDGTKVTVQHSSLAAEPAFRVYLEGETIPTEKDKVTGHDIGPALHLSVPQIKILISALEDIAAKFL